METIAKEIYGADGIELSPMAQKKVELFTKLVRNQFYSKVGIHRSLGL